MSEEFRRGVKAFFDHLSCRAANHWHADPHVNASCEAENELVMDWATDALVAIDEESFNMWSDIVELRRQRDELLEFVRTCAQYQGDGTTCHSTYQAIVTEMGERARNILERTAS